MSKESTSVSLDLVMDNPLSQNPDSMWSRFFRNAELERVLNQDISRLYPERSSYFKTSICQGILRRILLLWCLSHPDYGYKQGMHELLAPLLYVLHVDVELLSEVRKNHDDQFADKFDDFPLYEGNRIYNSQKKSGHREEKEIKRGSNSQASKPSELDPQTQMIISLSDSYGAEGELGAVMSEKFMEHDAYSMFDALMSGGSGGSVSMVEFFTHSRSTSGFLPVIEASAALYHLLSLVDSSLHSHLVELGVEPQYFALRWLRVLFGREFSLKDLLIIWDEVFAHDNLKSVKDPDSSDDGESSCCGALNSSRGAFISAFAVSMILYLRSSLLATENGTACLQRLLNFPDDANLAKLMGKAQSLQALAADANDSSLVNIHHPSSCGEKMVRRGHAHSHSLDLYSSRKVSHVVPDCYWEEQWRNLHKEEEVQEKNKKGGSAYRKGWSEKVRLRLSRTESTPTTLNGRDKNLKIEELDIKRNLLEDLEQQLGSSEKDNEVTGRNEGKSNQDLAEINERDSLERKTSSVWNDAVCEESSSTYLSSPSPAHENTAQYTHNEMLNSASAIFGEESSSFCFPSPLHGNSNHKNESESVSVASNSLTEDGSDAYSCGSNSDFFPPPNNNVGASKCKKINDLSQKSFEKKNRSRKFQWLWKLGRNAGDGAADARKVVPKDTKACDSETLSMEETVNQHSIINMKSLGQSMHGYIQVIESFLQQNQYLTGKPERDLEYNTTDQLGKIVSALQELTNISNLLSEM